MSRLNILNFRLDPLDRELFDWYCGFQGKSTSKRLRELIESDINQAKQALQQVDVEGNEYLMGLKRQLGE